MTNFDAWFLLERGEIAGPYSYAQLEQMRATGVCNAFSKVSPDRQKWTAVDDLLNDRRAQASRPPPVSPPPFPGNRPVSSAISDSGQTPAQRFAVARNAVSLRPFPIVPLLLLHYLSAGVFTFFWTTGSHGRMPVTRADDPSGARAIGLCLAPFFNLYWFFIVYPRLAARVNSLCWQYRLPPAVPLPLAYTLCLLLVVPVAMATAGVAILVLLSFSPTSKTEAVLVFFALPNLLTAINYLIIAPVFCVLVQRGMNQVFEAQLAELAS